MPAPVTYPRPSEGWTPPDRWGHIAYVSHQPGGLLTGPDAPQRGGYECFFVARHGSYTRFSYRAV